MFNLLLVDFVVRDEDAASVPTILGIEEGSGMERRARSRKKVDN